MWLAPGGNIRLTCYKEGDDDANVIYVSGLVYAIEDIALFEMFSQFGKHDPSATLGES